MDTRIRDLESQISQLSDELRDLRRSAPPEPFENYGLVAAAGPTSLIDLFGDKDELLVIHNMGQRCEYCSLWADGFNGLLRHFQSRSAFVVVTPNPPTQQKEIATRRGWQFSMAQDATKEFTTAAGFWTEADGWWPGATGFRREGDRILRTGSTTFGPNDQFCSIWPLMDLIGGPQEWEPRSPS